MTIALAIAAPDADITIRVAGHVLDYRDTAEIAGIVRLLCALGFVPQAEYAARRYDTPPAARHLPGRHRDTDADTANEGAPPCA